MKIEIGTDLNSLSNTFEPAPAGVYQAKVTNVEKKHAKDDTTNQKSDYLNWQLDFPVANTDGSKRACGCWLMTSLSPKATGSLKVFLTAVGAPFQITGDSDTAKRISFATEDVLGRELKIVVSLQEYQGKKNNKVDAVQAL
jgi:hypothetical protein